MEWAERLDVVGFQVDAGQEDSEPKATPSNTPSSRQGQSHVYLKQYAQLWVYTTKRRSDSTRERYKACPLAASVEGAA